MILKPGDTVQVNESAPYSFRHAEKAFQDSGRYGVVDELLHEGWYFVTALNGKDRDLFSEVELTLIERAKETSA